MTSMEVDGKTLDVVEVVEIVPDKLVKHIVKQGDGDCPVSGMMCVMHYTGCLQADGSKFDSSRDRDSPFEFQVGVGQVIQGWEQGVITMKKGEEAVFVIDSELGYGENGAGASIPGGANLIFHVELLDFYEKDKDVADMDQNERMAFADEKKRKGNEKLKEGDYTAAAAQYLKGLEAFTVNQYPGEPPEDELDLPASTLELKKALHNNLSIAYLKSNNFMPCVIQCQAVLKMEPGNVKANFNLIQANAQMGEYEVALKEATRMLNMDHLTESQKNMYKVKASELKKAKMTQDKKEQAMYGKMFT